MPQHPLEKALLSRNPPRDPKLRNDKAGDGEKALRQDDYTLEFLKDMYKRPTLLPTGEITPIPDIPTQDEYQKQFEKLRSSDVPKYAPPDWRLLNIQPIKDK